MEEEEEEDEPRRTLPGSRLRGRRNAGRQIMKLSLIGRAGRGCGGQGALLCGGEEGGARGS